MVSIRSLRGSCRSVVAPAAVAPIALAGRPALLLTCPAVTSSLGRRTLAASALAASARWHGRNKSRHVLGIGYVDFGARRQPRKTGRHHPLTFLDAARDHSLR